MSVTLAMNKYLIPVFALAIAGYTTAPLAEKPETPEIPAVTGMVAVAVDSAEGFATLNFAKINPATCHVEKSVSFSDENYPTGISGDTHVVEDFETGLWVIEGTTFESEKRRTVTRFENGALAFEVKEDDFIHLGKLELSIKDSSLTQVVVEKLAYEVAGAPVERLDVQLVKPHFTAFSPDPEQEVIGCNPIF